MSFSETQETRLLSVLSLDFKASIQFDLILRVVSTWFPINEK